MKVINDIINKRKKMNLRISDITKDLFIKSHIIKQIETSNFDYFKNKIYLYGYLIKYLEYLHLNPDEYKEDINKIIKQKTVIEKQDKTADSNTKKQKMFVPIIILIIILISASAYFFIYFNNIEDIQEHVVEIIEEKTMHTVLISADDEIIIKYSIENDTFTEQITLLQNDTYTIVFNNNLDLTITNFLKSSVAVDNKKIDLTEFPEKDEIIINFSKKENKDIIWRLK